MAVVVVDIMIPESSFSCRLIMPSYLSSDLGIIAFSPSPHHFSTRNNSSTHSSCLESFYLRPLIHDHPITTT